MVSAGGVEWTTVVAQATSTAAEGTMKRRPLEGSQVPSFDVKRVSLESVKPTVCVALKCRRTGCGGWFVVRKASLRKREFGTMPCPHCMKVSKIPDAKTLAKI